MSRGSRAWSPAKHFNQPVDFNLHRRIEPFQSLAVTFRNRTFPSRHRAPLLAAERGRAAPEPAGRAGAVCPAPTRASDKSRDSGPFRSARYLAGGEGARLARMSRTRICILLHVTPLRAVSSAADMPLLSPSMIRSSRASLSSRAVRRASVAFWRRVGGACGFDALPLRHLGASKSSTKSRLPYI